MAATSSRLRSACKEDLDNLLVETIPDRTEIATKYGMKFFHVEKRSRNKG